MAGIKEACGNMEQICETMRLIRPRMDLFSGDDNLNIPILAIGGRGIISVVSNLAPKQVKDVYTLTVAGKLDEANKIQDSLLPLIDACFVEVNPIPVKAGANMIGFNAGTPRSPLTELEEGHKAVMQEALKKAGIKSL
jgi:4-hydroxy-tetrahydrodipicolinate synthase